VAVGARQLCSMIQDGKLRTGSGQRRNRGR
jgi:hypothetical protein